jgi:hypothetical protein
MDLERRMIELEEEKLRALLEQRLNMSQEMERSSLLAKSQVVVFSFSLLR